MLSLAISVLLSFGQPADVVCLFNPAGVVPIPPYRGTAVCWPRGGPTYMHLADLAVHLANLGHCDEVLADWPDDIVVRELCR